MYQWGQAALPVGSFDGQLYADNQKRLWSWNATTSTWARRRDLQFRQTAEQDINTRNKSLTVNPEKIWAASGVMYNDWPVYDLAFVEICNTTDGTVYAQQAHIQQADLQGLMAASVPSAADFYTENATIRVYEAVSQSSDVARVCAFNELYSSLRGAASYRSYGRRFSRGGIGLPRAGVAPKFEGYHNIPAVFGRKLGSQLVVEFLSQTPASDDPDDAAVWTPTTSRNLYDPPRPGMMTPVTLTVATTNGRSVWNSALQVWQPAPIGSTLTYFVQPWAGGKPVLITSDFNSPTLSIIRGLDALVVDMPTPVAMIVQHLQDNSGDLHAFLVRPLGLTHLAFRPRPDPVWQVVATTTYCVESSSPRKRLVPLLPLGDTDASMTLASFVNARPIASHRGRIATRVVFHLRNSVTGERSGTLDTVVTSQSRHCAPIFYTTRRGTL